MGIACARDFGNIFLPCRKAEIDRGLGKLRRVVSVSRTMLTGVLIGADSGRIYIVYINVHIFVVTGLL